LVSLIVTFHLSVVVVGGGAGGVGTGEGGTGVGAEGERPHPTIGADDNRIASRTTHRTAKFRAFVVLCIECLHTTDPQIESRDTRGHLEFLDPDRSKQARYRLQEPHRR
jgi:hypothetical protein